MNEDWYRSLPYDSARYDLHGGMYFRGLVGHIEFIWKKREECQTQINKNLAGSWKMKLKLRGGS